MLFVDSVDKIVTGYFAAVTREPFTYKGKQYEPLTLHVSPDLFRGTTCPANCGGCCKRFSLDYLPNETLPYDLPLRAIVLNGKEVLVYSDIQDDHERHHCMHLDMQSGRCGIHGTHPFSCDFELIRFAHFAQTHEARVTTRLYGRGWAMLRVDGQRGALCETRPITAESAADVRRKLLRLAEWCDHFGIKHCVGDIIKWGDTRPTSPLTIPSTPVKGLF